VIQRLSPFLGGGDGNLERFPNRLLADAFFQAAGAQIPAVFPLLSGGLFEQAVGSGFFDAGFSRFLGHGSNLFLGAFHAPEDFFKNFFRRGDAGIALQRGFYRFFGFRRTIAELIH